MFKKTVDHDEILAKISRILPRTKEWSDFGSEMELILRADGPFHMEDNAMTTVALDAKIVPHTVQLPVVRLRKWKERDL